MQIQNPTKNHFENEKQIIILQDSAKSRVLKQHWLHINYRRTNYRKFVLKYRVVKIQMTYKRNGSY